MLRPNVGILLLGIHLGIHSHYIPCSASPNGQINNRLYCLPPPTGGPAASIPEVAKAQAAGGKLLHVVEEWLRGELEARRAAVAAREAVHGPAILEAAVVPTRTPFDMPSKHLAFFR